MSENPVFESCLHVPFATAVSVQNAGYFVSHGIGRHPERTIDSYEIIFVNNGTLCMREGRKDFTVNAGETLILHPYRRHKGTAVYPPDLSFYWIHFDLKSDKPTEHSIMRIPQIQVLRDPDKMTEFFRRFLDDQERKCLDPRSASLLLLLMLNEICVSPSHPPVTRQSAMTLVQQITTYIAGNYSNEISTSVIAKALVRNPDYLERIFKTATGISITTAIHRRRLKKAKSLLMESNFSIDRIAGICGFSDATYFRRIFKRGEGMSPSTYRKLYSQMHVNTG
jgi:AraC-like DNA-binding protein